ncbi:hypothetical protein [Gynuella sunshinyii]|uniref:Uncharacterized protein n=1 Tax=Gynuella sunshinyii YC6258 TaxID=1445510 RepID=A0A0C5VV22_9GAMM|nr:hypothetical protein [Gynuella sunshinyii]AJQ97986.1 hypothetical Protein YC6258_05962 [Gynuella sunshinyii YC6258]
MSNGIPLERHWSSLIKRLKRRTRLYAGLTEARTAAILEHEIRLQLQALVPHWSALQPGTSAEEICAAILIYRLNDEARDHCQAFISDLPQTPEHTAAIRQATILSQPLATTEDDAWTDILTTPETTTGHDWKTAMTQLLQQHKFEAVDHFATMTSGHERLYALALAVRAGDAHAFETLSRLEAEHPEQIWSAYWLCARPDACERILHALETPHTAHQAAVVWEMMSGQTLSWQPTVGSIDGQKRSQGPKLPDPSTAQVWWQQHQQMPLPLLHGKPLQTAELEIFLQQYCGQITEPLWWLRQYQQQQYLPDMHQSWHLHRLQVLNPQSGEHAHAAR